MTRYFGTVALGLAVAAVAAVARAADAPPIDMDALLASVPAPNAASGKTPDRKTLLKDVGPSGAVWVNKDFESGKSKKWWIEQQKAAGDILQAGVTRDDPELIAIGIKVLDWGLKRQATDGSFEGSAYLHSTSLFVEGAARGLLALKAYRHAAYADVIARMTPQVRAAAYWMRRPEQKPQHDLDVTTCTHRGYIHAAALGQAGVLTGDPALIEAAGAEARAAIARQKPDGVNPEKDGFDVNYQCLGVFLAAKYYTVCPDPLLRGQLTAMIDRALAWELGRVNPDGTLRTDGSTRTGVEKNHNGNVKKPQDTMIAQAFYFGARITGNARFARAADGITAAHDTPAK